MQTLELKVPPPVVAVLFALAMWWASKGIPAFDLPALARMLGAGAIALVGGALSLAGEIG